MVFLTTPAEANQRPRPVLALICNHPADPLCQALFQALAEVAPAHAIRFNPDPPVPDAVEVTLHRARTGDRLTWHDGDGASRMGDAIGGTTSTPSDHAGALLFATPDLIQALKNP